LDLGSKEVTAQLAAHGVSGLKRAV
jgi:hypothetical protein